MTRISPRTCFWPLAGCLVIAFGLSFGLTFRSNHHCYAGTCGEWLFPLQARLHVVVWYLWLALSVAFLGTRALRLPVRTFVNHGMGFSVPLVGKTMRLSGVLLLVWVLSLYGILVAIWWIRLRDYFEDRGAGVPGNDILAAIALTGHLCDVTMGMTLLPVSRNSALASFFKLSPSTIYTFHVTQAYVLFSLITIHGCLYASWAALYNRHRSQFLHVFPVLNPTYRYHEVWPGRHSPLGIWRASLIFTGITSSLMMIAMFLTSFPAIRRKYFNLFYFTHLISIAAVIVICLHASTMFYCTVPGLLMWILDWLMRLYELSQKLESQLSSLGRGWYSLTMPLPRERLRGCACHSPLAHFYIHHTSSSIREIHPFTTITHLASKKSCIQGGEAVIEIQFLFRKRNTMTPSIEKTQGFFYNKPAQQWTDKLASLVDDHAETTQATSPRCVTTTLRLEGPYFIPATLAHYHTVVCLVAGTGLSGALAIAAEFHAAQKGMPVACDDGRAGNDEDVSSSLTASADSNVEAGPRWHRCVVVWSVREADWVELPFFKELQCPGLEFRTHLTGPGRARLDLDDLMGQTCGRLTPGLRVWAYISGPRGFVDVAERACSKIRGLECFAANWD